MDCVPKQDVLLRLRKIEGQVRGLQRMIEEEKECASIVHQLCAVRKALDKVGFLMLTGRLRQCAGQGLDSEKATQEALELFLALA